MKYAIAIAAFAALTAAQVVSNSTSPSRIGSPTARVTGGNTDIPYPTFSIITPTQTDLSALTKIAEHLLSDASTYLTSLTAQAAYSEFTAAVGSAAAKSETEGLLGAGGLLNTGVVESLVTATPTWWTKLATSAQAYYTSIAAAEQSIVSSDFKGPAAPTAVPMMNAAGVAAAGALAGAALLL